MLVRALDFIKITQLRPRDWAADPAELAGSGRHIVDVLDLVPTGRLVVLGEPGAGKTMLAVRLVLDLLTSRSRGKPVPVLISLASWNPAHQGLYDWLDRRLTVDYPGLRAPATDRTRRSWARALLDQKMILPVLDGLDEISNAGRSYAIARINEALGPGQGIILLSRSGQYSEATSPHTDPGVRLAGAAGIALCPLRHDDVAEYLRRSADGSAGARRWMPVLTAFSTPTPSAQALTTPLMVSLARTIYNPRPGEHSGSRPDPIEMLDQARFPDRTHIEQHLFEGFLRAAYRQHPNPTRRCPWSPVQAEHWLIFLARHLEHNLNGSTDIRWWEISKAVPSITFALAVALASGLAEGLPFGALAGVVAATLVGLATNPRSNVPAQRIRWSRTGATRLGALLVLPLILGFFAGVPADLTESATPRTLLARDKRSFKILTSAAALFVFWVATASATDATSSGGKIAFGALTGLLWGFAFGLRQTQSARFALVRYWLALRGRLPWRLMRFLSDAHEQRGVLRQVGAVYQFRHVELQRYLATRGSTPRV